MFKNINKLILNAVCLISVGLLVAGVCSKGTDILLNNLEDSYSIHSERCPEGSEIILKNREFSCLYYPSDEDINQCVFETIGDTVEKNIIYLSDADKELIVAVRKTCTMTRSFNFNKK